MEDWGDPVVYLVEAVNTLNEAIAGDDIERTHNALIMLEGDFLVEPLTTDAVHLNEVLDATYTEMGGNGPNVLGGEALEAVYAERQEQMWGPDRQQLFADPFADPEEDPMDLPEYVQALNAAAAARNMQSVRHTLENMFADYMPEDSADDSAHLDNIVQWEYRNQDLVGDAVEPAPIIDYVLWERNVASQQEWVNHYLNRIAALPDREDVLQRMLVPHQRRLAWLQNNPPPDPRLPGEGVAEGAMGMGGLGLD